ncbi:MAG TPA: NAD-dependent epimerase/dehydratase family protein [Myxococcota bacterium]|nr:NAD-dependent epimerase/dehydratase family protein [Myxococcota bacterium]
MSQTVLVTGGTGFVASWCIVELLRRGHAVRASVRGLAKEGNARAAVAAPAGSTDRLTFVAADLTRDEGWDAAVAGCDAVLHVASPLGAHASRDPNDLIVPARDGTLRVLRAATQAGVGRVVMTSAAAAARPPVGSDRVADETVWTDLADRRFDAYRRSKVLAERAAWEFMSAHGGATTFTTILPGAVFGPVLAKESLGSVQLIDRLLKGQPPGVPRFGFSIVDVRDLADLHVRAMTSPAAAGERFLAVGEFLWMKEIADALRAKLGARAARVPTRAMPDLAVRLLALFVPQLRMLAADLGRRNPSTAEKARRLLGFAPRPAADTVVDCAESLLAGAA